MVGSEHLSGRIRFGEFEVDLRKGELRKGNIRVQIQEQPFQVLATLLDRPGEVVSRQDLIRRLWPEGTHVDFDRGLNAAVTRLRQALLDSAEMPRYVETVARKGYRFVGQVTPIALPEAPRRTATLPVSAADRKVKRKSIFFCR
jgi:DNA-binding winged helix-turn-helix (wHTH) protein